MKHFNQYPLPYLELDTTINLDNFETDGMPLIIDEATIVNIFSTDAVLRPTKFFPNPTKVTPNSKEYEYISNTWINKSVFSELSTIINNYDVKLSCDTVAITVLIIDYYFNKFENKIESTAQNVSHNESEISIYEIHKFVEFMQELTSNEINKASIEVYVKNVHVATFDAGIIFPEIRKWHYGYFGHNIQNIKQWLSDDASYYSTKRRIRNNPLDKNAHKSSVSEFKSWIVQSLFNGFNGYFTNKSHADYIYFLGDILAVKNIFNLKQMKKKGRYDTIYRCLKSE